MSQTWGRTAAAGTWPHPKPVWTLAALLVALLSSGGDRGLSVPRPSGRRSSGSTLRRTCGVS